MAQERRGREEGPRRGQGRQAVAVAAPAAKPASPAPKHAASSGGGGGSSASRKYEGDAEKRTFASEKVDTKRTRKR